MGKYEKRATSVDSENISEGYQQFQVILRYPKNTLFSLIYLFIHFQIILL